MLKENGCFLCIATAAVGALMGMSPAIAQEGSCKEATAGAICQPTPEIVGGNLVSAADQHVLGLVSLSNDCSGTFLNQQWILTTDHCVAGGVFGGPPLPFTSVQLRAAWTSAVATPTRFVRNWFGRDSRDVALIFLGDGDLGPVNAQPITGARANTADTLTKFGRGIFAYATTSAGGDIPAQRDGQYRRAQFHPSAITPNAYTLSVNAAGQVGNGGDSGGADRITTVSGPSAGFIGAIYGVQSTCHFTARLPGHPSPPIWDWVTNIDSCTSASLESIANEIFEIVSERPSIGVPCSAQAAGCGVVEISKLLLLN